MSIQTALRSRLSPVLLFSAAGLLAAQTLSVEEFPWVFGKPQGIVASPDGILWVAEEDSSKIAQLDRDGNLLREISLPAGSAPHGVVVGPDGRVWFTEMGTSRIGRVDARGTFVEFPVGSSPESIAVGPDGNLWFTEESADRIGKMDAIGRLLGEFPIPTSGGKPRAIMADPCGDASLWFTEQIGRVGRIDTAGRATETANTGVGSNLRGIARGPAGDCSLYVADRGQDCIVKLNSAGQIVNLFLFAIGSGPTSVVAGPDGNLWFTENGFSRIGQVTTAGVLKQEVTIPRPAALPDGIAVGLDANIWFTEAGGNRVGRVFTGLSPLPTPTPTPGGLTVVPRHAPPAPRPFRAP
jgi:streptogramin lyase